MSNKIISFRDCYKIVNPTEEQWKTFKDSASLNGKRRLRTYFEATHSAISNKNERAYLPSMMRIGADSFTKGKRAPILKHHNPDADPVGKVVSAQYIDTVPQDLVGDPNVLALIDQATPIKKQVRAMASFLRSKAVLADGWRGLGYVKVGADIIDPTTIEQMESGLFDAVSVGFGSDHAFCSICFADWLDPEDGMCSHIPGKTYKDEDTEVERKANLIPGNMFFKELSLVNFDADPFTTVEVEGFAYDSVKEEDPVHKEIFPTQMIWEVRDSEEATGMIIEIKDGAPIELNDDESKVFEVIKEARPEAEDSVLADFAKKIMALKQEDGKYLGQDEAEIDEKTYIVYALEDFETQGQTIDAEEVYAQMEVELAAMAKDGILSEETLKDAKLSSEQRSKLGEKTFCGPGRSFPVPDCCVSGQQKIKLLSGEEVEMQELVRRVNEGQEVWIYSFSLTQKAIVPAQVTAAWKAKTAADVVRVTLDNGESVVCTPNHPFLTRDFEYVEAAALKEQQSLMPLYIKDSEMFGRAVAYEKIYQPWYKYWEYTHHMVARENIGQVPKEEELIHHIDEDKQNNDPKNLEYISRADHSKLHKLHDAGNKGKRTRTAEEVRARSNFMKNRMAHILGDEALSVAHSDAISKGKRTYDWNRPEEEIGNSGLSLVDIYFAKELGVEVKFLAERLQVETSTIRRWLNEADLSEFKHPTELAKTLVEDCFAAAFGQDLEKMYCDYLENPNFSSLQDKYKIDRFTIKKWFQKAGFETDKLTLNLTTIKETRESILNKWQEGQISLAWLKTRLNDKSLTQADFYNHKVMSVEKLDTKEDVYDIEVEGTNNFALSNGVFVHNSHVTAARRLIGRYKGPGNKTSILACVARKAKALGCSSGSSDSAPNTQPDPIAPVTDSVKQPKDLTDDELRALFADVETTMIERKLTVKRECSECVSSLKAATEAKEAEDKAKKELISSQDTVSVLRDELRHEFSSHKILIDECVTIGQELRRVKTEYAALLSLATGKQDSLDKAKAEFTDSKDFDIIYKTFVDSVDFGKIIDKMTSGIAREPEGMVDDPTIKTDKDNDQKVSLSKTDFELVNRMREFLQDKEENRAALLFDRMRRNGVLGEQITWDMIVSQTKITCE